MFVYVEKATGKIFAASEQDIFTFPDAQTVQVDQPPMPIDEYRYDSAAGQFVPDDVAVLSRRKEKQALEVNTSFELAMGELVTGYPEREIASWPQQEKEARAYLADPAASTPLLDALAAARGVTKDALAAKIVTKADQFAAAAGALIGKRQALEDAINAAQTVAGVEAVVW